MKLTRLPVFLALAAAPFALAKDGPGQRPQGQRPEGAGQHEGPGGPGGEFRMFEGLDDATKAKLKAAHEVAEKDPAVIKAKEDVKKAMEAAHAAHKAAMLKADPSLAETLDKVEARMKERREKVRERIQDRREKHGKGKEGAKA